MAITPLSPGIWRVRVYRGYNVSTGRDIVTRHSRGTEADARRLEAQLRLGIDPSPPVDAAPHEGTVLSVLADVIEHLAALDRAARTIHDYRVLTGQISTDEIALVQWADLRVRDVDAYYRRLVRGGMSAARIGKFHAWLRNAGNWAVRWEWAQRNVVALATPPSHTPSKPSPPSTDAVHAIFGELAVPFRRAAILAAILGVRRSELCALRWSDVDADAGSVTVARAIDTTPGVKRIKSTKTSGVRQIRIDTATINWLDQWRKQAISDALAVGAPWTPDSYLAAIHPGGGDWLRPDTLTQAWGRARGKAGHPTVQLKNLRHWSASALIAAGEDTSVVTARLGHADGTTARRFYIAAGDAAEVRAAEIMGEHLRRMGGG